jgi:hypothetical protein
MPESSETEITPETEIEEVEAEETEEEPQTITKEEYDKLFARMQAADKNKSKAETELTEARKKLEEIENSKLDETERTKKELETERSERQRAADELKNLRLTNAFLMTKGVEWEDPEVAFTILTSKFMDSVEIGSDGKVTGLDDAVKRLAKEKPYLTKKAVTPSSEVTGTHGNGKRKGEEEKPSKEKLAAKFPAMRRN